MCFYIHVSLTKTKFVISFLCGNNRFKNSFYFYHLKEKYPWRWKKINTYFNLTWSEVQYRLRPDYIIFVIIYFISSSWHLPLSFFYLVHFYPQILNVKLLRHFTFGKIVTKPHRIFFVLNGGLVLIVINIGLTIFAFKVQVWYTALFPQCPCLYYASVIPYWHAVIYRPSTNSPDHYPSVASVTSYYIEPTHYIINLFSLLFDQH